MGQLPAALHAQPIPEETAPAATTGRRATRTAATTAARPSPTTPTCSTTSARRAGVGRALAPRIDFSLARHAAFLLTAPIIGFVARDASGSVSPSRAPSSGVPATPSAAHWLQALPRDPAGPTATPNTSDAFSYTDDLGEVDPDELSGRGRFSTSSTTSRTSGSRPTRRFAAPPTGSRRQSANRVGTGFAEPIDKTVAHARAIERRARGGDSRQRVRHLGRPRDAELPDAPRAAGGLRLLRRSAARAVARGGRGAARASSMSSTCTGTIRRDRPRSIISRRPPR